MEPAVVTLDTLPLEVLDAIVLCLHAAAAQPSGGNRAAASGSSSSSRKRSVPPRGLGCLAAVSRRMRLCCIDRADGVWQSHDQAAFGAWPQHCATADNAAAHLAYSTHLSTRVRLRMAVWARTKPAGLGSIPIRLPVNPGRSDAEIQATCRQLGAALIPDAPSEDWLLAQLPIELIELWRAVDGQPVSTTFRQEQLIIPGFRLMSLGEVAAELGGEPLPDETPSFAAGGGGGLGGDWLAALLATDPSAAPYIELPLTAPQGIQRYTVRFSRTEAAGGGRLEAAPPAAAVGGGGRLNVCATVRLRGMIGDGQEKAESLVEFFRGLA